MVSVGPTTSMRMEKFEKEFVEQTGVKVIIGKGGMGPNTEYACKNYKAIHCVFPVSYTHLYDFVCDCLCGTDYYSSIYIIV